MKKFMLFRVITGLLMLMLVINLGMSGCSTEKPNISTLNTQDSIELSVESGEYWQGKMKVFIFSIKKTPQLAAWIEDENENYLSTITVTNRGGKNTWRSAPKEGRPEALPVWNSKVLNGSSGENIDAVSSATSKENIEAQIAGDLLVNGNEYNLYLEINHSFDYNEFWTEDNSGVNGQPSVIYHAKFIAGKPGKINLVPIGYGSVDGSSGKITGALESLTTSLKIIKSAGLTIK